MKIELIPFRDCCKIAKNHTLRTNLIRHDVNWHQDACKYLMAYHQMSDGVPVFQITMWIELLSVLVVDHQEKLSTRIFVFLKSTKTFVCLFISKNEQ